jgi:UPF0042 nucleotide-binding protein
MGINEERKLVITVFSFGFKHGMPVADLVWDMRFLPNPYWVDHLKDRSGMEDDVAGFVLGNVVAQEFIALCKPLLDFLCRQFAGNRRRELTIAVGCTGGRHRSVAVVEYLRNLLDNTEYGLIVFHRDIEKL